MKNRTTLIIKITAFAYIIRTFGLLIPNGNIIFLSKLLFALMIWCAIIIFPYKSLKYNNFNKYGNLILKALLILGIYQICITIFSENKIYNLVGGNKYITLFFNADCALNFAPPIFAYLATKENVIQSTVSGIKKILYSMIILLPLGNLFSFTPWFTTAIQPYTNKKNKFLIIIGFVLTLFVGLFGGARSSLVFLAFCFAAYFISYVINSRLLNKIFCIVTIILPFILFVPMMYNNGESVFEYLSNNLNIQDEEFTTDTRTFLYQELAEDLTMTDSWIMGKGAFSHYYSHIFLISDSEGSDFHYRMTVEVGVLNFLLHGGLVYVILYYGLFVLAILTALFKGKSKFMQCNAALLSGYFFCSFFACFVGISFTYIYIFITIGFCLSRKWLNYSDQEIVNLFRPNRYENCRYKSN